MRTILDFVLEGELGQGASCLVHRARRLPSGEAVALKCPLVDSPQARAALVREAAVLQRVEHPNVIRLVEVVRLDEEDPPRGLALELIDGPTLAQRLTQEPPLDRGQVARLGLDLARALDALHAAGIIHADVKPANVLLGPEGKAVLVDLDNAIDLDRATDVEPARMDRRLTERYAAPELRRGSMPSAASDGWALATVLLEALPTPGDHDRPVPETTDPDPLVEALLAMRHDDPDHRLSLDELMVHLDAVPPSPAEVTTRPRPPAPAVDPHPTVRWGARPPDPLDQRLRAVEPDGSEPPTTSTRITVTTTVAGLVLGLVGCVALFGWVSDTFSGPQPSLATPGPEPLPNPVTTTTTTTTAAAPPTTVLTGHPTCPGGDLLPTVDSSPPEALYGDLDGTGCIRTVRWDPVATEATVAWSAGPRRYRLGQPGDQLVLGDWDADGRETPGLYRPATGEAFLFDGWAEVDAPLPSAEVHDTGTTAGRAIVRTAIEGTADHLIVTPP